MFSCCCCCHRHRHCCCGSSWDCGCGCQDEDMDNGLTLTRFPVYVSYPAFFAGDDAIDGANRSIFGSAAGASNGGSSCGCRS